MSCRVQDCEDNIVTLVRADVEALVSEAFKSQMELLVKSEYRVYTDGDEEIHTVPYEDVLAYDVM